MLLGDAFAVIIGTTIDADTIDGLDDVVFDAAWCAGAVSERAA